MDAETFVKSRIASGALTHAQIVNLVRAFQLQNGLKADGKPGPITFDRVDDLLAYYAHEVADRRLESEGAPNLGLDPAEWLFGIDIDHHQRVEGNALDLDAVQFAFVGVTEGTSGRASVDPKFREHLTALSAAGVSALGVYHFGRPSSARRFGSSFGQPLGEAQNFARQWEIAEGYYVGRLLPPVLDMEDEKEQLSNAELIDWTLEWCEYCEKMTGRTPIIYTYFSFIHTQLKDYVGDLTRYPLWLADYRGAPPQESPRDIPSWPWLFWQFTGKGTVRGIQRQCDRNVFRGTRAQLEGLLA